MQQTYAVAWSRGGGVYAGSLELGAHSLKLRGGAGSDAVVEELPYRQLGRVRRASGSAERVRGRVSLVLELLGGGVISIASVGQPGALNEVAERIAAQNAA